MFISAFDMSIYHNFALMLLSMGVIFLALGVLFFLDKGLLCLGNLLFVIGTILSLKKERIYDILSNKNNHYNLWLFGLCFLLSELTWPVLFIPTEIYFMIQLMGNFDVLMDLFEYVIRNVY